MNYSEVKELLQAGFTADEIRQMEPQENDPQENNPQENNPQDSQGNPQGNPQPEQTKPEEPAEADPIAELKELFQGLKESNDNLARVIQASNVQHASFGSNSVDDINKKAEDALRSLIRPDLEKEGN